jgi:hypothetical protein
MADAGKSPPPKEPAREEYADQNGKGEEGYKKNQENIEKLAKTPEGKAVKDKDPEGKNGPIDKEDRIDSKGNVYSWDQDADGGKGAWGVSGKVSEEDAKKAMKGEDVSDKIDPYSDEEYEIASGLTNEPGTGGYTDEYDIKK